MSFYYNDENVLLKIHAHPENRYKTFQYYLNGLLKGYTWVGEHNNIEYDISINDDLSFDLRYKNTGSGFSSCKEMSFDMYYNPIKERTIEYDGKVQEFKRIYTYR